MAPVPVNASAMGIFAFVVAVVIPPWLVVCRARVALGAGRHGQEDAGGGRLGRLCGKVPHPVIRTRASAGLLLLPVARAAILSAAAFDLQAVTAKGLPCDSKSELQMVLDLPLATAVEETQRVVLGPAGAAAAREEVAAKRRPRRRRRTVQPQPAGPADVLRNRPHQGDRLVTLRDRTAEDRSSCDATLSLSETLRPRVPLPAGATLKVVETPTAPVVATLRAEIYDPDAQTRRRTAEEVAARVPVVGFILDLRNSYLNPNRRFASCRTEQ